jgi:hypothetical protein
MAAMTLAQYRARLAEYRTAETAILKGQSYTIKDRTLTRANLKNVQYEIRRLISVIDGLERGGTIRCRRGVPRDL